MDTKTLCALFAALTNAPLAAYVAPGARRQGRDGLVLGLKYNL